MLFIQETKLSKHTPNQEVGVIPGYDFVDSYSTARLGYSGTRTYVRKGLAVHHRFGKDPKSEEDHCHEGRIVTSVVNRLRDLKSAKSGITPVSTESDSSLPQLPLVVINTYVPNAGEGLKRLKHRVDGFDNDMRKYLKAMHRQYKRPVIWAGDFNVAPADGDRFWATSYDAMETVPGFTPQEKASFKKTLKETNMVDAFRHLYPKSGFAYTFWSYRENCRPYNNGWRIDGFVVSRSLLSRVIDVYPLSRVYGSDHCPVVMLLNTSSKSATTGRKQTTSSSTKTRSRNRGTSGAFRSTRTLLAPRAAQRQDFLEQVSEKSDPTQELTTPIPMKDTGRVFLRVSIPLSDSAFNNQMDSVSVAAQERPQASQEPPMGDEEKRNDPLVGAAAAAAADRAAEVQPKPKRSRRTSTLAVSRENYPESCRTSHEGIEGPKDWLFGIPASERISSNERVAIYARFRSLFGDRAVELATAKRRPRAKKARTPPLVAAPPEPSTRADV